MESKEKVVRELWWIVFYPQSDINTKTEVAFLFFCMLKLPESPESAYCHLWDE